MNPVYTVLVILLVALSLGRYYVQRGELRRARAVALSAMLAASAALPPTVPPPPPRPSDERKRAPSPAFGTPLAQAPDAGADGGGTTMLAQEPETKLAGELQAIDVEHTTEGFVVGAPLR